MSTTNRALSDFLAAAPAQDQHALLAELYMATFAELVERYWTATDGFKAFSQESAA